MTKRRKTPLYLVPFRAMPPLATKNTIDGPDLASHKDTQSILPSNQMKANVQRIKSSVWEHGVPDFGPAPAIGRLQVLRPNQWEDCLGQWRRNKYSMILLSDSKSLLRPRYGHILASPLLLQPRTRWQVSRLSKSAEKLPLPSNDAIGYAEHCPAANFTSSSRELVKTREQRQKRSAKTKDPVHGIVHTLLLNTGRPLATHHADLSYLLGKIPSLEVAHAQSKASQGRALRVVHDG